MIILLIILLFLIKIGLKLTLIGMKVSSYIYKRYKEIQSNLIKNKESNKGKNKNNDDLLSKVEVSAKKVVVTTGKVLGKVAIKSIEIVVWLFDKVLSLLISLLSVVSVYVIIVDVIVFVFLVGIAGFYINNFIEEEEDKHGYTSNTYYEEYEYIIDNGGGSSSESGGNTQSGGVLEPPSGEDYQTVYQLLSQQGYASKAQALATVYVEAKGRWGRETAIGLMANVQAEGSPGKIEGINFKTAFDRGVISSSRKVTLNCSCSKKGTVTIDYWKQAPCEAHEIAGQVISSKDMVSAMLKIPGSVPGIGVGSCQWSGGRRVGILNKYNSLSDFSTNSLLLADVSFIMDELSSSSYNSVISHCNGKSAVDCAKIICGEYEKPAGIEQAKKTRGNIAKDISSKLATIGK